MIVVLQVPRKERQLRRVLQPVGRAAEPAGGLHDRREAVQAGRGRKSARLELCAVLQGGGRVSGREGGEVRRHACLHPPDAGADQGPVLLQALAFEGARGEVVVRLSQQLLLCPFVLAGVE